MFEQKKVQLFYTDNTIGSNIENNSIIRLCVTVPENNLIINYTSIKTQTIQR